MLMVEPFTETLADRLGCAARGVAFYWLGQAGFLLLIDGRRVLIDPYLSDSLAEKYRGQRFPHERMMAPPISLEALGRVDLVLVTHHHTDHMDPATLAPLARAHPGCRFVVPRASLAEAQRRTGVGRERLADMDAGEALSPFAGVRVTALRAAHEELERSPEGFFRFLGYLVEAGGFRLFHSGDTVPFAGQVDEVRPLKPDVALLPVNGRRPELAAAGIAGNLTLEEAARLAEEIGAEAMIAHHYGMFAFNTESPERIDAWAARSAALRIFRALPKMEYRLVGD